jgi:integrase/recombinase XerD
MKIDRHGQAKILTPDEIQLLFTSGLTVNPPRDRALFAVCLYTACRISEAVTLTKRDVYDTQGNVRPEIIIRKGNTKGKLATRTLPVIEDLRIKLESYTPRSTSFQATNFTKEQTPTCTATPLSGSSIKLVSALESKAYPLTASAEPP